MQWLTWFFLESPAALGAAAALINFWLLVYWRRGGKARPLLIGLAVSIALLITQKLVVTRREHAIAILQRIERDVLAGRVNALADALAPGFRADNYDRAEFLELARRRLQAIRVQALDRSALIVERSEGEQFIIAVNYVARIAFAEYNGPLRTQWQITFIRAADGWQILNIAPPRIEDRQFADWGSVRP